MSTTTNIISKNKATLRFTAGYAALTSITFSMVASAPTPLYRLYQERLGLTPLEITLIFAIYSLTMVAAFLTVARLSDFVGRKPMILAALVLNALALVLFIEANTSTMLMVARAVQGVSTGVALATLGALITDAAPRAAGTLNSVTAFIGMTVGALTAGSFVAYLPWPTQLIFVLLLCLTLAEMIALFFVLETTPRKAGAFAILQPNLTIPTAALTPDAAAVSAHIIQLGIWRILFVVDALAHRNGDWGPFAAGRRSRPVGAHAEWLRFGFGVAQTQCADRSPDSLSFSRRRHCPDDGCNSMPDRQPAWSSGRLSPGSALARLTVPRCAPCCRLRQATSVPDCCRHFLPRATCLWPCQRSVRALRRPITASSKPRSSMGLSSLYAPPQHSFSRRRADGKGVFRPRQETERPVSRAGYPKPNWG